jgi:hypothetical protein
LLRQHKTHDLRQLDVVDKEVYVDWVWREFRRAIWLIFDEVVLGYHLHIGILRVDGYWSS